MPSFFYPEIDAKTVKNLLILRQLVSDHPAYFLDSPYPVSMETDIQALLKYTQRATVMATEEDAEIDMEVELKTLFRDLKKVKPADNDPDQMAYYRTSTALMERLLSLQSTAKNIKTMGEHHATVLNFIEEVCSPTQLEEFLKRLKDAS